jgi:hypothetical protein
MARKKGYVFDKKFEMLRVCNRIGAGKLSEGRLVGRNGGALNSPLRCRRDRTINVISKIHQSVLRGISIKDFEEPPFCPPISSSGSDSSSKNSISHLINT